MYGSFDVIIPLNAAVNLSLISASDNAGVEHLRSLSLYLQLQRHTVVLYLSVE